jgi:hypothetical protein
MKHPSHHQQGPANRLVISALGGTLGRGFVVAGIMTCVFMLTGCDEPAPAVGISEPDPELVFVRGYRSADDDCKLTGDSAFTVDFLDDTADLVTCPTGGPAAESLVSETSATIITQTNSYTLYSVSRS